MVNYETIDFILSDYNMPVLDGITATKKIRLFEREKYLPEKPIIIITGNSTDEKRTQAKMAGANGYLVKPASIIDIGRIFLETLNSAKLVLLVNDNTYQLKV
jgi:CheY-like chemotaxis protein